MHAANDFTSRDLNGQDSLSQSLKNRIHQAAQKPETALALLRELCPGLDADRAMAALDVAFEAQALEQAAGLLGGEWTNQEPNR